MAKHKGVGGFGYCIECGTKPGHPGFNPNACKPQPER